MIVDIPNTLLAWRKYREQLDLEPILIVARFRQAGDTGNTFILSHISDDGPVNLPIGENA